MDLQEAERKILSRLYLEKLRPPMTLILSAPLGVPVLHLFHRLLRITAKPNELKITVNLKRRRKPLGFTLFQRISLEIQRRYPDTWASVTERTPLASPLLTPSEKIPRGEGYRWMQRIAQALAWFAVEPALKIVVYHLEHADPWSLETLRYLMDHLSTTPLQILALWKSPPRPEETPLGRHPIRSHLQILEVDPPPEHRLIQSWTSRYPRDLLLHLARETRRRPLALSTLLDALNTLTPLDLQTYETWKQQVPDLLESADQALLFLLTTFEHGLTSRDLRNLLVPSAPEISRSLDYLKTLGLAFEDRGYWGATLPGLSLPRPDSGFFRETAIQDLPQPPQHKARFFEAIGQPQKAVDYWIKAGEQALAQGHLHRALQFLAYAEPHHPQPFQVLRKKLTWLNAHDRVDEIRKLTETLHPQNLEEFLLLKRAEARFRPISDLLKETEAYLATQDPPPPDLLLLAAGFALDLRDVERAGGYLSRVQEKDLTSEEDRANYWDLLGRYHTLRREVSRARSCYRKLRQIVETLKRPEIQAVYYNNLAGFFLYLGDLRQARYYLERAQEVAGAHGFLNLYQVASMNQFLVYERNLQFPQARALLLRTFRKPWFRHAPPLIRLLALNNLVLIYFRLGEFEKTAHIYRRIHSPFLERYPLVMLDSAETCIHALHTYEGHAPEIRRILDDFHRQREQGDHAFPQDYRRMLEYLEGIWMLEEGHPDQALHRFQEVLGHLNPRRTPYLTLTVQLFHAEATVLAGHREKGRHLFRQVLEEFQKTLPVEVPYGRYLKVRSLVRTGEVPVHEIQDLLRDLNKIRAFGLARRVQALYPEN